MENANMHVTYANDNYGIWQSNFNNIIDRCLEKAIRVTPRVKRLKPDEDYYFVLKPEHSGCYSTTLEVLLEHLGTRTVIITGIADNICVSFTANDAYMRNYKVYVPSDCCASNEKTDNDHVPTVMESILKANYQSLDRVGFGTDH